MIMYSGDAKCSLFFINPPLFFWRANRDGYLSGAYKLAPAPKKRRKKWFFGLISYLGGDEATLRTAFFFDGWTFFGVELILF